MKQLVLLFLFFSTYTFAQNTNVFKLDTIPTEGLQLDKGWKWHAGDNPEWAKLDYDDSNWEGLDPSLVIPELQTKTLNQHPPRLWLRLKFNNSQKRNRLVISVNQSGATEIYINNHRIHSFGIIDTLHNAIKSYDPNGDYITLPLDTGENILAIKYFFEPGIRYKSVFDIRHPLFSARAFSDRNELESNKNKITFFWEGLNIGVPLILFVVHFIMFLFYRPIRANLWYSLWGLLSAIGAGFLFGAKTAHHLEPKNEYALYTNILFGLGNFSLVYSLFLLLRHKKKSLLIPFICIIILSILSFLVEYNLSFIIEFSFSILFSLLVLYLAYSAYKQGHIGGKYVMYSMGLYIIVWILFVFSFDIFNFGWISDILFHIAMFCLPITVSILLGIDTRNIHNDLMEVTLEKQQLLQSQNQVLEKEVTERTLDLQYKNKELEIESSLEKVRSRSLAMHNSSEIQDVAYILYGELKKLKFQFGACSVYLIDADDNIESWVAGFEAGEYPQRLFVPKFDHPLYHDQIKAYHDGKKFETLYLTPDIKQRYDDQMFYHTDYKNLKPELIQLMRSMPSVVFSMAYNKYGALHWGPTALSEDEAGILQRFSAVFEQSYTRYLDIKKAEEQTREAKIEAALERVRNRSMVMLKSEEVMDVAVTVYDELQKLDFKFGAATIIIIDKETGFMQHWLAGFFQRDHVKSYAVDNIHHPLHAAQLKAWRNEEKFISIELSGAALKEYAQETIAHTGYKNLPDEEKEMLLVNEHAVFNLAFMKHGALMWAPSSLSEEQAIILQRFAQVFEQTFTRFLDLQKAEAQAREAQIEAAVERVRAQSMAMHHTSDLTKVNAELLTQLNKLNIAGLTGVTFYLVDEEEVVKVWDLSSPGNVGDPNSFSFKYDSKKFPILGEFVGIWKAAKQDYFILDFPKEKLEKAVVELQQIQPEVAQQFRNAIDSGALQHQWNPVGRLSNGILSIDLMLAPSEDIKTIVIKMAGAFNMAYQRFLDLQNAEARAREAQVEASLERVRSKAMAMHSSQDLADTIGAFYHELQSFSITPRRCGVGLLDEESRIGELFTWNTTVEGHSLELVGKMKMEGHPVLNNIYEHWLTKIEYHPVLRGNEIKDYYEIIRPQMNFPEYQHDDVQYGYFFYFPEGGVYAWTTKEMLDDELTIYRRFTSVLSLTYKRYKDLQIAEAQSQKAKIEVALERVRARALAMQHPEELIEVAQVMRHEMGLLGVEELETSSIYIHDENSDKAECWYAIKDSRLSNKKLVADHFELKFSDTWVGSQMFRFFNSPATQFSIPMQGAHRKEWIEYCSKQSKLLVGFYGETIPDRTYHLNKFSNGTIGAATVGNISSESWDLLQRAASVFSLAYSRFKDLTQARNDLQRLKTEKLRAETALTELQATQKQLIQSEKMASLGELTAGIAHEIQNPLNFVNNFSEVNTELLEELISEKQKVKSEKSESIENDLISTIRENELKISHHGKRADAIVKSMLQHSRKTEEINKKEPTNINAIADEYFRLAYHGLKAKDKTFNSKMESYFDSALTPDESGIGYINVVPQEIGRVLLNLINNAFYAVNEKKKLNGESYDPVVSVSTKKVGDKIEISVKDNGNGIPQKVLDKIFQPFFTTKPTGQGTGLGLSLAYDIVKAHGGSIAVDSSESQGTFFTIQIPIE